MNRIESGRESWNMMDRKYNVWDLWHNTYLPKVKLSPMTVAFWILGAVRKDAIRGLSGTAHPCKQCLFLQHLVRRNL